MAKANKAEVNLSKQIDMLYKTRLKRLELNREAEALKTEEQMLKDMIINALKSQPRPEFRTTSGFLAELRMKAVPSVADWDAFYAHITKTQEWDLIHRRVTDTAVRARWEAGDEVPGVARTDVYDLSITQSTRR